MLFLGGHRYHLILLIVRIVTQRKWHLKKWKKLLISNYVELENIVNKKVEIETDADFEDEFILKREIQEEESETKEKS